MVSHSRTPGFVSSAGSRLAGQTRMSAKLNFLSFQAPRSLINLPLKGVHVIPKPNPKLRENCREMASASARFYSNPLCGGYHQWPHTFLVFRALVLLCFVSYLDSWITFPPFNMKGKTRGQSDENCPGGTFQPSFCSLKEDVEVGGPRNLGAACSASGLPGGSDSFPKLLACWSSERQCVLHVHLCCLWRRG